MGVSPISVDDAVQTHSLGPLQRGCHDGPPGEPDPPYQAQSSHVPSPRARRQSWQKGHVSFLLLTRSEMGSMVVSSPIARRAAQAPTTTFAGSTRLDEDRVSPTSCPSPAPADRVTAPAPGHAAGRTCVDAYPAGVRTNTQEGGGEENNSNALCASIKKRGGPGQRGGTGGEPGKKGKKKKRKEKNITEDNKKQ